MSDHEDRDPNAADEARGRENSGENAAREQSEFTPSDDAMQAVARRAADERPAGLPIIFPPPYREKSDGAARTASRPGSLRRRYAAAAALALAVVGLGAATFIVVDHRQQADLLAQRAQENAQLAQTVSALNARLQAVESAKGRDELAELRRSVGDMKTAAATSRELGAAIAQLTQRVEKLDREQGAKLDKLGERVDHEATATTAELAARLDKLDKKPTPTAQPIQAAPPPAPAPRFNANVSMEPTGSIDRPRQVLRGYVVLGAQGDIALVGGRYGERAMRPGDYLPGAGRIERVERQGPNWVVVTEQGLIGPAYAAPD